MTQEELLARVILLNWEKILIYKPTSTTDIYVSCGVTNSTTQLEDYLLNVHRGSLAQSLFKQPHQPQESLCFVSTAYSNKKFWNVWIEVTLAL